MVRRPYISTARATITGVVIFALAVVAFTNTLDRPARAQAPTVCGCPDAVDMINRLNMAEAAIEIIKAEKGRMAPGAGYNERGKDGLTNYERLRNTIDNGIAKSAQMLGAKVSEGKTDEFCKPRIVQPSSACIDEIAMLHETDIHVPACNASPTIPVVGGRLAGTIVDYADEEIRGYEREVSRIRELLRARPGSCRPGWIGFINYYEKRTLETNITLPATQSRVSGSERSFTELVRSAKVLFRENQPSIMNLFINESAAMTTQTVVKIGCKGGLMARQPDRLLSSRTETRSTANGVYEGEIAARFEYAPTTGDWTLSFEFPSTIGNGSSTITGHQSGNCNSSDDGEKPIGGDAWNSPYASDTFSATGKTDLHLDVVRVEYPLRTFPMSAPNVSFTHTGRVVFSIYTR